MLQSDLAFVLGQPVQGLNAIIAGRRGISPDMSKALGEALGVPPDHFADLQMAYDLARAKDPEPAVSVRAAVLQKYPVREMIRRGWLHPSDTDDLPTQLAKFFGLRNMDEVPYLSYAARKSGYEERGIPPTQLVWLFRVRQVASAMVVPRYSQRALTVALERLHELLIAPEAARHVPRLLSECGIRFVMVEALPQGKIDGVCFWLDANSPVVGMSTRFDRIDNFWFVLRHELEHVLHKHGTREEMVDAELEGARAGTEDGLPAEEKVANAAASAFCVPPDRLDSFLRRKHPFYYEKDVVAFATLHAVHPGIVIGQMQHRLQRYDYLKKYQVKIRQHVLPGAIADGWRQSVPA